MMAERPVPKPRSLYTGANDEHSVANLFASSQPVAGDSKRGTYVHTYSQMFLSDVIIDFLFIWRTAESIKRIKRTYHRIGF